jgi:hypothetical protein
MSDAAVKIYQVEEPIQCPNCGAAGNVRWECAGRERVLVSVSPGFYERIPNEAPYPIELVCLGCGTAQRE